MVHSLWAFLMAHGTSMGLAVDVVGALLVWGRGLPTQISRAGASVFPEETLDETLLRESTCTDTLAHLGIGLLVLGFSLQLLSSLCQKIIAGGHFLGLC